MTITNSKIAAAGIKPKWAPFHGFSLLFDNPGNHLTSHESGRQLLQVNTYDPETGFYHRIRKGLEALGLTELAHSYLFCPLPSSSYHVTVWDGVNIKNVAKAAANDRAAFQQLLSDIPKSLDSPLLDNYFQSELLQWEDWEIRLQCGSLTKWRDRVLAVQLEPADSKSFDQLRQLESHRIALIERFHEQYQLETKRKDYTPHLTLGYFANPDFGAKASYLIDQSTDLFRKIMGDETIAFSSISLYGLTDMASFFRIKHL